MNKSKKICLLGDGAVGKTSLIRRYVLDTFDDKYITTIGTKVSKKVLKYPKSPQHDATNLTLMIWDIIGQRGLPQLHSMYFKGASAGFLVCDMTRRPTLQALESWKEDFFSTVGKVPLVILVNKADLRAQAQMNKEDLERVAKGMGAKYFLTSAKTGMNVEEAFFALGKLQLVGGVAAAGTSKKPEADITFKKGDGEGMKKVKVRTDEEKRALMERKRKAMAAKEGRKPRPEGDMEGKKPHPEGKRRPDDGVVKKKKKKKKGSGDMDFDELDNLDVEDWG